MPLFKKPNQFSNHKIGLKKIVPIKESSSNSPNAKPKSNYPSLTKALFFPKKLINSQSMLLLNTKYNQFVHMNNNKKTSNKLHSNSHTNTGMNTNNYIINTLNVSTKNLINKSVEYSDVNDYEAKTNQLQKENSDLKMKVKEREKMIKDIEKKNKYLENELKEYKIKYKIIQNKYNEIKGSEDQLLSILYIIDQSGIGINDILNRYNEDKNWLNESKESNRSLESAKYVPITLEHPSQPVPLSNIPKLNFSKINQISSNELSQFDNQEYDNEDYNANITKNTAMKNKKQNYNNNTYNNIGSQFCLKKTMFNKIPKTKFNYLK